MVQKKPTRPKKVADGITCTQVTVIADKATGQPQRYCRYERDYMGAVAEEAVHKPAHRLQRLLCDKRHSQKTVE